MYFMLAGRPPFRATGAMGVLHRICNEQHRSLEQINNDVPIEVVRLINRLLAKDPTYRFDTMHVVESELEKLLAALQSGGLSLPRKTNRWLSKIAIATRALTKRSITIAIPAVLGAVVAMLLVWQFVLPYYLASKSRPLSIRRMTDQLNDSIREDSQLQNEMDRIERELISIQFPSLAPEIPNDVFGAQVRSVEERIKEFKSQH